MSRSGRSASPVETLIYSVLPELSKLPERVRRDRVAELVEYCEDILQRCVAEIVLGLSQSHTELPPPRRQWTSRQRSKTISEF